MAVGSPSGGRLTSPPPQAPRARVRHNPAMAWGMNGPEGVRTVWTLYNAPRARISWYYVHGPGLVTRPNRRIYLGFWECGDRGYRGGREDGHQGVIPSGARDRSGERRHDYLELTSHGTIPRIRSAYKLQP